MKMRTRRLRVRACSRKPSSGARPQFSWPEAFQDAVDQRSIRPFRPLLRQARFGEGRVIEQSHIGVREHEPFGMGSHGLDALDPARSKCRAQSACRAGGIWGDPIWQQRSFRARGDTRGGVDASLRIRYPNRLNRASQPVYHRNQLAVLRLNPESLAALLSSPDHEVSRDARLDPGGAQMLIEHPIQASPARARNVTRYLGCQLRVVTEVQPAAGSQRRVKG